MSGTTMMMIQPVSRATELAADARHQVSDNRYRQSAQRIHGNWTQAVRFEQEMAQYNEDAVIELPVLVA